MNTLKIIQVLAKIGKILSAVIFVFCIVGFCFCIAGILILAFGIGAVQIGGVTLHGLIAENSGMSVPTVYAAMSAGLVLCAGEAVLCKFAEHYFARELVDGTPFTLRGSKELMRLGILSIAVPVAAVILCAIGIAIARAAVPEIGEVNFDGYASAGIGIMLIVLSLFCRYGAEISEAKEIPAEQEQPAQV